MARNLYEPGANSGPSRGPIQAGNPTGGSGGGGSRRQATVSQDKQSGFLPIAFPSGGGSGTQGGYVPPTQLGIVDSLTQTLDRPIPSSPLFRISAPGTLGTGDNFLNRFRSTLGALSADAIRNFGDLSRNAKRASRVVGEAISRQAEEERQATFQRYRGNLASRSVTASITGDFSQVDDLFLNRQDAIEAIGEREVSQLEQLDANLRTTLSNITVQRQQLLANNALQHLSLIHI